MRQFTVPPAIMCKNHLLGEHRELHMFEGHILLKRGVKGYIDNHCLEPLSLVSRHNELVAEMKRRGWTGHKKDLIITSSDMEYMGNYIFRKINPNKSLERILQCPECKKNYESMKGGLFI